MKNIKIHHIIFFLFFYYISYSIVGQEKVDVAVNLKFKHISSKEGLSQSSVIAILQDKKGYLWFGTRDGLNKYDGVNFVTYRHNSEDKNSLSHSWITTILEDNTGGLWIGTKDGLNKYNSKLDNFVQFKHVEDESSISDNEIWEIIQIDNVNLLVASNDGIDKIEIKSNAIKRFEPKNNIDLLAGGRIRSLLNTNEGGFWFNSIEKINYYNALSDSIKSYNYPENFFNKEAHVNNAPTLFIDSNNQLWLGYAQGLAKFNESSLLFEDFKIDNFQPIKSAVRSICEDDSGNLWIGSYTGLFILNKNRNKLNQFVHNENNPKSLSQNSIYKIKKDFSGDMWIGTWAGGINFFDRSYDNFKQLSAGASNNMLNYKVISSIIEGGNDELWIGTEGGGINIYNKKSGIFTYYTHNPNNKNSISSNNVKSMLKDKNGNFWIGTHDGGINFLNTERKPYKFEDFDIEKDGVNNIKDYRILELFEDINGNIWIGTLTGGLFMYDTSKRNFTKLEAKQKSVTSIIQSTDANILFFGGAKGLEKVNINTKIVTPIVNSYKQNLFDSNESVNCILENNGSYWIGTEGQGLYFYDDKSNEVKKYGIAEGLLNEVIYGVLAANNNLWISTNNGLSRLNLTTNKIDNFDESDGLQSNEFNYGAYLKTKNGELMFGGTNGLNYFNPNDIVENSFIPSVDIYSLKVSNKPYLKITDSVSEIILKYDQNDFSFDFTALSFSQANKNNFAYKLEGFDPEWNYIGISRTATYTNLDEGVYVFKVKASNNNGLWNEKGDSIKVTVLPAPWKTWWAYLCYLTVILLLIYFIRNLIVTRIKEKNELKQEKLDKEKLEEVNKLKLQLFTNISHDFRTPLTLISGPVERLMKINYNNEVVKRNIETIHRNTNILLQLINELLDFRKSDGGKLKLYASKSNIIPFIENVKLAFEELAIQRNINYQFSSTHEIVDLWFDKVKVKKILFNLISNAFKFTSKNNNLLINTSIQDNCENDLISSYFRIDIINYGKVISEEHIPFIFDRFYQLNQEDVKSGTGIGLSLVKSLVELHKGIISVTSSEEKGTCFSVFLPLGKDHLTDADCVGIIEENIYDSIEKPVFVQKELLEEELIFDNQNKKLNKKLQSLLIIEDNQEVRGFIKNIFIDKYNVYEAENGKQGVLLANKNEIDLIISDIMMPEMNGFELCEKIKTNLLTSHIPVILLTAKTSDIHKKEGFKLGADAYITKPFDANILELRVDNLLKSRRSLIKKFKKEIILEPKGLTVTSTDEIFLNKAIELIGQNISDSEFNVHVFTEQMNMSRSALFRKVKALTGQSISEFIRTVKLKRAGQLLIQTQMNVSEIAYEVGFNDLKYFRKCFKILFNEIPSAYRLKNTSNKA